MALGSASEVRYMLGLSQRLGFLNAESVDTIRDRYGELVRGLQRLISALE
jgi:four helix bundle protein